MKNINILQIITAIMAVFSNRNFFSTMNRFKNILHFFNREGNTRFLNILTIIMIVFNQRNFFSTMNRFKNIAMLFICGFAIVGLTACGGGGGSSASNGGGNDPINIADIVNLNDLNTYILQNLNDTDFFSDVETEITGNTNIDQITITISNNSDTTSVTVSIDSWETEEIDIASLVNNQNNAETVLTITITYLSNGGEVGTETEATLTITVILQTQTLTFGQSAYSGTVGNTIQANANGDGTGDISYTIDNTDIATIDDNGVITPLTIGTAIITATIAADSTYNTATATATLTVGLGLTQTLTFNPSSYDAIAQGDTIQVSVTRQGTGTVSYTIANTDIATIDDNGEITPLTAGQTIITATIAADSTYDTAEATAELTVNRIQRSITPDSPISLDGVDATAQITIVSNGSTDDATYESANEAIATVSNSGLVTAVQTGEVTITVSLPQDNTHTDATATLQVQVCLDIVDCDGDGLIEINSLTKLHNMRYNLAGSSYKTSDSDSGATGGCPDSGCSGYELTQDLDFDADGDGSTWSGNSNDGYTLDTGDNNAVYFPVDSADSNSAGWMPIGDDDNRFTGTFNGNGYTISNLAMRRSLTHMGLFGYIDGAEVRAIGLIDNLSDYTDGLEGDNNRYIGGLIGEARNDSRVIASYATGDVSAIGGNNIRIGGLIGTPVDSKVIACYATGDVNAGPGEAGYAGGLVGTTDANSRSYASYATGNVSGGGGSGTELIGGLCGRVEGTTIFYGSYATGNVNAGSLTGKVAGFAFGQVLFSSYGFGTVTGGIQQGTGDGTVLPSGVSSAADLTASNVGNEWNSASDNSLGAWDFGTSSQAPALKYADYDGDGGDAISCGDDSSDTFSNALCGTLIPGQR